MPSAMLRLASGVERIARIPAHLVGSTFFDLKVTGREHIPAEGPLVVASNHFSHLDVPLVGFSLDRYTRFLAVDELYGRSRLFDAMIGFFGAIPLDRDGYPVGAMRTAISHLEEGQVIGLFPEGRRVEEWGVDPPKKGAAWLAWMSGAPLLPVAIHGTQTSLAPAARRLRRTAVRIWIDEPLWWYDYLDRVDPLASMMSDWYERVNERLEPWREHG